MILPVTLCAAAAAAIINIWLSIRIGLIQNTLKPRFRDPQLVLFASDNGLAVEGLPTPPGQTTASATGTAASSTAATGSQRVARAGTRSAAPAPSASLHLSRSAR